MRASHHSWLALQSDQTLFVTSSDQERVPCLRRIGVDWQPCHSIFVYIAYSNLVGDVGMCIKKPKVRHKLVLPWRNWQAAWHPILLFSWCGF